MANIVVSEGVISSGTTLFSGDSMYIKNGGSAVDTYVSRGGGIQVSGGGMADSNTLLGSMIVWGSARQTEINSGGVAEISAGGAIESVTLNYSGSMYVSGAANSVTLNNGGYLYVAAGGTATAVKENGGCVSLAKGAQVTFIANSFNNLSINTAITVHSGTKAYNTTINRYGSMFVYDDGEAYLVTVNSGGRVHASGGKVTSAAVYDNGEMNVSAGASASFTDIYSGGCMNVCSMGVADSTTVNSGGSMVISKGGSALAIKENGGNVVVNEGTVVSFVPSVISGMEVYRFTATLHSGTTATAAEIQDFGYLDVYDGGRADSTTIKEYGYLNVYGGGSAEFTTIDYYRGRVNVNGGAVNATTIKNNGEMRVYSGGRADSTTISAGYLDVYHGGRADSTTVEAGCIVQVYSSGVVNSTTLNGGSLCVTNGSANANVINAGGVMIISEGGRASDTQIDALGSMTVSAGGIHYGQLEIEEGAAVHFYQGSVLDFTIATQRNSSTALVSHLNRVLELADCTITTKDNMDTGTYVLAGDAAGFNKTITVYNTGGSQLGTISVGETKLFGEKHYRLLLQDDVLSLDVFPEGITVTANSDEKTYDGTALTNSGYTWKGVLKENDALEVTVEGSITNCGTAYNKVTSVKVWRDGADVTSEYTINPFIDGTLKINQRRVTLKSASDSKVYDGTPLTNDTVTVSGDGWADGEGATYNVTGSQTLVGSRSNTFTYKLNNNTKSGNYQITKELGTLTVTGISEQEITITVDNLTQVYDGKALTATYHFTEGVLLEGDSLEVTLTRESLTDAGKVTVAVKEYRVMRGETDVTSGYKFTTSVNGSLEVAKRKITLKSASASKQYDGTPLTNDTITVSGDGWAEGEGATYTVTGSQTDVGKSENTFTYTVDGTTTKATNYEISPSEFGILEVTKAGPITIIANSSEKKYDGQALTAAGYTYTGTLLAGDRIESVTVEGSITDAGSASNAITGYRIMRGDDDVTDNYEVLLQTGTLTVHKRTIEVETGSGLKTYDGTPLTNDTVTVSGDGWATGEGADISANGSQLAVGYSDNTVSVVLNEGTKADNYEIVTTPGQLVVTPSSRVITITAESFSRMYDGKAWTAGYTCSEGLFGGDELEVTVEGTITDAGTVTSKIASYKVMHGGIDVTDAYTINTVDGLLEITQRHVTLKSASASKAYDGTPLTNETVTVSGDGWVDGEGAECTVTGSQTDVGSSDNTFTYKLNDNTKASNYVISTETGTLEVIPAGTITITAASADKIYDGDALTDSGFTYAGQLLTGDRLVVTVEGTITDAGTAENKVTSYKVMRGDVDVTKNYRFNESISGTLTVAKRQVTLKSDNDSKAYDGTPLTNGNVTVSGDGWVYGEGASYTVTGSQLDVGSSANAFTYTLEDGTKASNYEIKKEEGSLTVTKAAEVIVIHALSDDKIYDGSALTAGYTFNEEALIKGDVLVATVSGSQTDVGTSANKIASYKVMRGDVDVTGNYNFATYDGYLTVSKRTVYLQSADDQKVYDGTPLTNDTITVTGDGWVDGEGATYTVTGSQLDVGSSSNTFTYTLNDNTKSGNYVIHTTPGVLTVKPAPGSITVKAESATKLYDKTPLTAGFTYEGTLMGNDKLVVTVSGSQTDVGTSFNEVTSYKVMRGDVEVTSNYVFNPCQKGILTVYWDPQTYDVGERQSSANVELLWHDVMSVHDGGQAWQTIVGSSGTMNVQDGGLAMQAQVASNGSMLLSGGGRVQDAVVKAGGTMTVLKDGLLYGRMQIDDGASVAVSSGAIIDFTVAAQSDLTTALISNWELIEGAEDACYTLTANKAQSGGSYKLAAHAADFNATVTAKTTAGVTIGTLAIGQTVRYNALDYTLRIQGDDLYLTIGDTLKPEIWSVKASQVEDECAVKLNVSATDNVGVTGYRVTYKDPKTKKTVDASDSISVSGSKVVFRTGTSCVGRVSGKVTVLDAAGNQSSQSFKLNMTDVTAPEWKSSAKSSLTAMTQQLGGKLKWNGAIDNVKVKHYKVKVINSAGKTVKTLNTSSKSVYLYGIKAGVNYTYQIYARDAEYNYSKPLTGRFGVADLGNNARSVATKLKGGKKKSAILNSVDTVDYYRLDKVSGLSLSLDEGSSIKATLLNAKGKTVGPTIKLENGELCSWKMADYKNAKYLKLTSSKAQYTLASTKA